MSDDMSSTYRSSLGIVFDIVQILADVGRDGLPITQLSVKAHLSNRGISEKIKPLINVNLVKEEECGNKRLIFLTEKGVELKRKISDFTDFLECYGLKDFL